MTLQFEIESRPFQAEGAAGDILSGSERKFAILRDARELEAADFNAGSVVLPAGLAPLTAVLIVEGYALWNVPGEPHRLGPGAVMGIAEGLAHLPMRAEVIAETALKARLLSIIDIEMALEKSPTKLPGIMRLSLERILGDRFFQARQGNMFLSHKPSGGM